MFTRKSKQPRAFSKRVQRGEGSADAINGVGDDDDTPPLLENPLSPVVTAKGVNADFDDLLDGTLGDQLVVAWRRVSVGLQEGFKHANLYYNNSVWCADNQPRKGIRPYDPRRKARRLNGDHGCCAVSFLNAAIVLAFVAMTLIYGGLADAYVEEPKANFLGLDAWTGECAAHRNARWTSRIINVSLLIGFTLMNFLMTRRLFAHIPTRFQHLRKGHSTKWVIWMIIWAAIFCLPFFFLAEKARTAKEDESSASSSGGDCGPTYSDWVLDLIDDWVWDHWFMSLIAAATQFPLTFNAIATFAANPQVVDARIKIGLLVCRLRERDLWAWVQWCLDKLWKEKREYQLQDTIIKLHGTYLAAFTSYLFYLKRLYRNDGETLQTEIAPFLSRDGTFSGNKLRDSKPLRDLLETRVRVRAIAKRQVIRAPDVEQQTTSEGLVVQQATSEGLERAIAAFATVIAFIGIGLTLYWDTFFSSLDMAYEHWGWFILVIMAVIIYIKQTFFFGTLIYAKLCFIKEKERDTWFMAMPLVWFDTLFFFVLYLIMVVGLLWCALFAYTGMAYLALYHHENWNSIWNDYIFFPIIVIATSLANSSGVLDVAAMPVQMLSFCLAPEEKAEAQMLLILGIGASVEALDHAKKMEVMLGLAIKMWKDTTDAYAQQLNELTRDHTFSNQVNQAMRDAVTLLKEQLVAAQAQPARKQATLSEELAQLARAPQTFLKAHGYGDDLSSLAWGRTPPRERERREVELEEET